MKGLFTTTILALALVIKGANGHVIGDIDSIDTSRNLRFKEFEIESTDIDSSKHLQRATDAGINHITVMKKIKGAKYWFDNFEYDIQFTQVDEVKFNKLMEIYSGWSEAKSSVKYSSGKSTYGILDFLPPVIQSTVGSVFLMSGYKVDLPAIYPIEHASEIMKKDVTSATNCWGTVYETMRQANGGDASTLSVFYAPMDAAKAVLSDPLYSIELSGYNYDESFFQDASKRNQGLQPGDVVVIGDKYFQHTAVFIDDDFYFEKAGTGNTATYRITHFDKLFKTWAAGLFGWSYRRFDVKGVKPLPAPVDLFTVEPQLKGTSDAQYLDLIQPEQLKKYVTVDFVNADDNQPDVHTASYYYLMCSMHLERGIEGRARLPALAYDEKYWNASDLRTLSKLCLYMLEQ